MVALDTNTLYQMLTSPDDVEMAMKLVKEYYKVRTKK